MRPLLKNALQRALFRNRWKPPLLLKTEIQNKTKQNKNNIYKWNRWISSEIRWKSSKYFFSPAGYATQIQNKLTSGGKKKSPKWRGKKSFWLCVLRDLLFCIKSFRLHVLISYSSAKHWGSQCYYREFWRGEPQKLSLVAARTFISKFPNQGLLDMSIMTPDSFTKICYGDQALKAHYTTGQ